MTPPAAPPKGFWEEHRGGLRWRVLLRKECLDAGFRAGYAAGIESAAKLVEQAARDAEEAYAAQCLETAAAQCLETAAAAIRTAKGKP